MSEIPHAFIERLQVRNFRSLADVDIQLAPLTAFVGPNGAGKSNLIDVLRFVRDALRGLDNAILDRGGMSALRRWSPKGQPYDVTIQLDLRGPDWRGEYGFSLGSERRGDYRVKWERCWVDAEAMELTYEIRDGEWLTPFWVDMETREPFPDVLDSSNLVLPVMMRPFSLVEQVSRSLGFFTIYPSSLREPQKPANPYPLDEKGQNLASVLRELKRSKSPGSAELLAALARVADGVSDFSVSQVGGYLVTRLHHGKGGPAFDLAQESDGTLRMLGLLTAVYQNPPRSLIAVEEPELTIHPGALGVLCDVLQEASTRSQVLITSHSPDLIYHFPAQALRVVEKVDGATQVGPVADHQRQAIEQKLFSPGEIMRMEGLKRADT